MLGFFCGFEGTSLKIFLDSSMVEHSAVNRGVVGSSPTRGVFWPRGQAVKTSPFHGGNTSSILVGVTLLRVKLSRNADVAQLAEQLICNQQVEGSSPPIGLSFVRQRCIVYLINTMAIPQ